MRKAQGKAFFSKNNKLYIILITNWCASLDIFSSSVKQTFSFFYNFLRECFQFCLCLPINSSNLILKINEAIRRFLNEKLFLPPSVRWEVKGLSEFVLVVTFIRRSHFWKIFKVNADYLSLVISVLSLSLLSVAEFVAYRWQSHSV